MIQVSLQRILALDLRAGRFGFVVMEGATKLLDWGVREFRDRARERGTVLHERVAELLEQWAPAVVVLKDRKDAMHGERYRAMLRRIRKEVLLRSITLRILPNHIVKRTFAERGQATKYAIAVSLAEQFLPLTWKLPPERRCWQTEDRRMTIFDAAAIATTYLAVEASEAQVIAD